MQRLQELQRIDAEQQGSQERLQEARKAASDPGDSTDKGSLKARLQRCAALQDNLQQRVG